MRGLRLFTVIASLVIGATLWAQVPVSPKYYGPNAFAVPECSFGRVSENWSVKVGVSGYKLKGAFIGEDATATVDYQVTVPLFSNRVNLIVWGQAIDAYRMAGSVCEERGLPSPVTGAKPGEIYFATAVQLLRQERTGVNASLRLACKTAAGGEEHHKRYYDSPGYFFDAAVGRRFELNCAEAFIEASAEAGFLCWQTGKAQQNDAFLYNIGARIGHPFICLNVQWGGYIGWQNNGDRPMVVRYGLEFHNKNFTCSIRRIEGLRDWDYAQASVSFEWTFGKSCRTQGQD